MSNCGHSGSRRASLEASHKGMRIQTRSCLHEMSMGTRRMGLALRCFYLHPTSGGGGNEVATRTGRFWWALDVRAEWPDAVFDCSPGCEAVATLLLTRGTRRIPSVGRRCRIQREMAMSVVRLMLALDCIDADSMDSEGRTPLSFAAEWGLGMRP